MSVCLTVDSSWDTFLSDSFDKFEVEPDSDEVVETCQRYVTIIQNNLPYNRLFWCCAYAIWSSRSIRHFSNLYEYEKVGVLANWLDPILKVDSDIDLLLCQQTAKFITELVLKFKSYEFDETLEQLYPVSILEQHTGVTVEEATTIINFAITIYGRFPDIKSFPDQVLLNEIEMMDTTKISMDDLNVISHVLAPKSKRPPTWCAKMVFMMTVYFRSDKFSKELDYSWIQNPTDLIDFIHRPIVHFSLLGLACGQNLL